MCAMCVCVFARGRGGIVQSQVILHSYTFTYLHIYIFTYLHPSDPSDPSDPSAIAIGHRRNRRNRIASSICLNARLLFVTVTWNWDCNLIFSRFKAL